ncbi:ferritin-like domain-containing protein [Cystobacter fuscus]
MNEHLKADAVNFPCEHGHIRDRADLISQLSIASELEHGLSLQYLFTAFSLKTSTAEGGLTAAELQVVLRWRGLLFAVAAQEMQHLTQASNLLAAVGGSAHLRRPNFPQRKGYFPMKHRWGLWPFSAATLKLYTEWERPASVPRPRELEEGEYEQELFSTKHRDMKKEIEEQDVHAAHLEQLRRTNPPLYELLLRKQRATRHETIGELYGAVANAFATWEDDPSRGPLIIGDPAFQVEGREVDMPQVIRVETVDDALRAIQLIVQQGEGDELFAERVVATTDSHYGIFLRMLREYQTLKARRPEFDPVRDVCPNPLSRLHDDNSYPGWRLIQDPFTSAVNELNSAVYKTMLLMLYRFFATPGGPESRRHFSRAFLPMMTTVIEPLGNMLTQLPIGEDPPSEASRTAGPRPLYAGPSFEISPSSELLPQAAASTRYITERLQAEANTARKLSLAPSAPRALSAVAAQLDAIRAAFAPPG